MDGDSSIFFACLQSSRCVCFFDLGGIFTQFVNSHVKTCAILLVGVTNCLKFDWLLHSNNIALWLKHDMPEQPLPTWRVMSCVMLLLV